MRQIDGWSTTLSTPISLDDPFTLTLFVVATVMMAGYLAGRRTNQRRSQQISNWLEPGLRSLGGTPTVHRLTRSAFRFQVTDARRPFQTVTSSVVLISREVLPTWLWERLRGNKDLLVMHVTLRQPPAVEAEIVDPNNELGRRGELQARGYNWSEVDLPPRWRLYSSRETSLPRLETIAGQVTASSFAPWRVALRRNAPHMLISMPVPDLRQVHSKQLVDMLTQLSKLAQPPTGVDGP
jgi:hypothetical protein